MTVHIVMDKRGFIPAVYSTEKTAVKHAKEIGGLVIVREVSTYKEGDYK